MALAFLEGLQALVVYMRKLKSLKLSSKEGES